MFVVLRISVDNYYSWAYYLDIIIKINKMTIIKNKKKISTGEEKMRQLIKDLETDENLKTKINEIKDGIFLKGLLSDEDPEKDMESLRLECINFNKYITKKYNSMIKKSDINTMIQSLSEKYSLQSDMIIDIVIKFLLPEHKDLLEQIEYSMCDITDSYTNFLSEEQFIPISLTNKKSFYKLFPVSLNISIHASKRDVLRYIEKNWNDINKVMEPYKTKNVKQIRVRKNSERDKFIYDKYMEGKKAKEISELISNNEKWTDTDIGNICKIISIERKRRKKV